jgi:hypothetical protein
MRSLSLRCSSKPAARVDVRNLKPERKVGKWAMGNGLNYSYHEFRDACKRIIKIKNRVHFLLFFAFKNSNSTRVVAAAQTRSQTAAAGQN